MGKSGGLLVFDVAWRQLYCKVSLKTRDEILTEGGERENCETGECSSDAVGGPAVEKLSLRFGKDEDGRQTNKGLNQAAT